MHDQSMMSNATDDLIQINSRNIAGIQTRQKQLTQYLYQEAKQLLAQQNSNYLTAAGGSVRKFNNSSSLQATKNAHEQSIRYSNLEPTHMLGDYNSVAVLPVIGNEINLDLTARRQFSKVELSKKDMQNFLVNGSISKEFIQSNKKELQKFIKSYNRSGSQNGFFKGYNEIDNLQKGMRATVGEPGSANIDDAYIQIADAKRGVSVDKGAEAIRLKNSKIFGKTQQNSITKRKEKLISPNKDQGYEKPALTHQQPEKGFHGETSAINNRVLETWINETLTDAQHLDIPGIILKPEYKNPISRYGIDRFTMTNSGLSSEEVDRIYRCLFVYSVGFFEMLRSVLAQTEKSFQTVTAIWKVFQVLLEYCCKTDYKIMMAEISTRYQESLEKLLQENLARIQSYIETERLLKQNIETMQNYQDKLEKDKQNEKQLRLKLEEEYMQNTKNHEEEVKLRLKFEGKLNNLYSDHRELLIKYDRRNAELLISQNNNTKLEKLNQIYRDDLMEEKKKSTNLEFRLKELLEWKELAQKDIKLKTQRLKNAEKEHGQVKEENEFANYNIQDSKQELENQRKKVEQLMIENSMLKSDLSRQNIMEKDAQEKMSKFENLYNDLKVKFDEAIVQKDQLFEQNSFLNMKVFESQEIIDAFRSQEKALKEKTLELETSNTQIRYEFDTIQKYKNLATEEAETSVQQLRRMNEERHKTIDALEKKTEECIQLQNDLINSGYRIQECQQLIEERDHTIEIYIDDLRQAHETIKENNLTSTMQLQNLTKNLKEMTTYYKEASEEVVKWKDKYSQQVMFLERANSKINYLEDEKKQMIIERDSLKSQLQNALTKITDLEANLKKTQEQLQETLDAKMVAEIKAKTLEEQVKVQQRMLVQQKDLFDIQTTLLYAKMDQEKENALMNAEDTLSGSIEMKQNLQALEVEKIGLLKDKIRKEFLELAIKDAGEIMEQNQVIIATKEAQLSKLTNEFRETKSSLEKQIKKDTKAHNLQVNDLEQKITQDSINFQQKQKKLLEDGQKLQKELTETKFNLKMLQQQKGAKGKQPLKTTSTSEQLEKKDKATQTLKTKNNPNSQSRSPRQRLEQNEGSEGQQKNQSVINTLVSSHNLKNKKIKQRVLEVNEDDFAQNSNNSALKLGHSAKIIGLSDQKFGHSVQKFNTQEDGTNRDLMSQKNSDSLQIVDLNLSEQQILLEDEINDDEEEQYDDEDEGNSFNDKGQLDFDEKYGEEDQLELQIEDSLTSPAKQVAMFSDFKEWLLNSEMRLLKKVKYMVINGIEVTPNMIAEMRKQVTIPPQLRNVQISSQQHDELQLEQELQTQKFRAELLQRVEDDKTENELITDRLLQEEVLQYKRKLYAGPDIRIQSSQTNSSLYPADGKGPLTHETISVSGDITHIGQLQQSKGQREQDYYMTIEDDVSGLKPQKLFKEMANVSSVKLMTNPNEDLDIQRKAYIGSEEISVHNHNGNSSIENSESSLPYIHKLEMVQSEIKQGNGFIETQTDTQQSQQPAQTAEMIAQAALKKKEAFAKQFNNVFSNFGANNKILLKSLLDEQKDRLLFRAKQLQKQRAVNPTVKNKKVGKYYLIEQKEAEDRRIAHMKKFLAELKIQHEKMGTRKVEEDKEAQRLEEEKIQKQIEEAQKRLLRMQRTVIIREDLIKQQELAQRQKFIEEQKAKFSEQQIEEQQVQSNAQKQIGISQDSGMRAFSQADSGNRIDHAIEIDGHGEMVTKNRSIVLSNKVFTLSELSQIDREEGEQLTEEIMQTSKLGTQFSPIKNLDDRISNELLILPNANDFGQIEAFNAGGTARLNRKVIEKKKTEEASEQQRRDNSNSQDRFQNKKKIGASTIRTLIKAVDSRKN